MTTPIVICDDSSFARKQLASALPDGCDVDITFAKDGQEGLSALQAKQIDIMFLDLNMPGLDGYQTLEAMQDTGIKTKVVVVSGDIQPDAQKRVKSLLKIAQLDGMLINYENEIQAIEHMSD